MFKVTFAPQGADSKFQASASDLKLSETGNRERRWRRINPVAYGLRDKILF